MKRKSRLKKISFDPEINNEPAMDNTKGKKKAKKKEVGTDTNKMAVVTHSKTTQQASTLKRKLDEDDVIPHEELPDSESRKDESKRSKKKKKHIVLVEEKKIKNEVTHQERSLNYLSKWKHSPKDWKFEKNRQAWLKQNMFDVDKLPEQFWNTLVEYFSHAKGNIRKTMVTDALKVVEAHENKINEDEENSDDLVVNRARDIIQSLQE